jgi:hypothetical protein
MTKTATFEFQEVSKALTDGLDLALYSSNNISRSSRYVIACNDSNFTSKTEIIRHSLTSQNALRHRHLVTFYFHKNTLIKVAH